MGGYYGNSKMLHSYAAGLFDGEGCIGIYFGGHGAVRVVSLVNTNLKVIQEFKKKYGGNIKSLSLKGKLGTKPQYSWTLGDKKKIQKFLVCMNNYLRIKRKEANVMRAEVAGLVSTDWAAEELRRLKHHV